MDTTPPSRTSEKPRLGCAGIVRQGAAVLLGRRNKDPNRGLWILPGGGIKFGETFQTTLKREMREEAGVEIEVDGFFKVYELINPPSEHRVILYFFASHVSGEPTASMDLYEVRYLLPAEIAQLSGQKLISPFVEQVLRDAKII